MIQKTNNKPNLLEPGNGRKLSDAALQEIKSTVHRRLLDTLDLPEAQRLSFEKLHAECSHRVEKLLNEQGCRFHRLRDANWSAR